MAASLGLGCEQSGLQRKRRVVDEVDSRRMLELMLGSIERNSSISSSKHTTLDLLGGSCALQTANIESAFELVSESPLPSGWEKCLDLKTGSIYYLNRGSGVSSSLDPRKATDSNWHPSPTTSEVTIEALSEGKATLNEPTCAEKAALKEINFLDLSLSLHVGSSSPSQPIIKENFPLLSFPPSTHSLSCQSPSMVLASTSSSSSSTSSPTFCVSFNQDTSIKEKEKRPSSSQILNIKEGERQVIISNLLNNNCNLLSNNKNNNNDLIDGGESVHGEEVAMTSMVTVGCAKCLMFVMLSKSNPKCPRCGTCPILDFPLPFAKKTKLGFS